VFNVGNYRRKINGAIAMHDFFDDKNQEGMAIRLRSGKFNTYATNHSTTTTTTTTHTHTHTHNDGNTQHDLP